MRPILTESIMNMAAMIEIFLILFAALFMVLVKLTLVQREKKLTKNRRILQNLLFKEIYDPNSDDAHLDLPDVLSYWNVLLPVIESIQLKVTDSRWLQIKDYLTKAYLKPLAKDWVQSSNWSKRNRAGRIYFLDSVAEDEEDICSLLHDQSFLNRSIASQAAIDIGSKKMIYEVLSVMGTEHPRRRYTYRHSIQKHGIDVYNKVVDIYRESDDKYVHLACLDIFSYEINSDPTKLIIRDIDSEYSTIRLMVAQIVTKFPSEETMHILLHYLNDQDASVRIAAADGLGLIGDSCCIDKLAEKLRDDSWKVRASAALSMKKIGEAGVTYLKSLNADLDPAAYDAARYALTLP